eukprot:gene5740-6032_t
MASSSREDNFLGVEIHRAGLATCISRAAELGLDNVKLIRTDVTTLLENHLYESSLDEVHIYFPDPWPNETRDGQRRVVRAKTVALFEKLIRPGGLLRIATDVGFYAQHVEATMQARVQRGAWCLVGKDVHAPMASSPLRVRGETKYERRAAEMGTADIFEFAYRLKD